MNDLTVDDTAARLGVSPARVRALIAAGDLPARKLGGRWVLDTDDVDAADAKERVSGRPWSPRMAWGLIALAEGRTPTDLSAPERSRLRNRLRHDPDLATLAQLTRKRSATHRLHLHRGSLGRALDWPGGVLTGTSARSHDLVTVDSVELYVPRGDLEQLVSDLHAKPASGAEVNLIVRLPAVEHWPFATDAGPVTVAFDLWDAGDDRSRRTARNLFEHALSAYLAGVTA